MGTRRGNAPEGAVQRAPSGVNSLRALPFERGMNAPLVVSEEIHIFECG